VKSESLIKKASRKGSWCASIGLWHFCTSLHQFQIQGSIPQLDLEPFCLNVVAVVIWSKFYIQVIVFRTTIRVYNCVVVFVVVQFDYTCVSQGVTWFCKVPTRCKKVSWLYRFYNWV